MRKSTKGLLLVLALAITLAAMVAVVLWQIHEARQARDTGQNPPPAGSRRTFSPFAEVDA